MQTNFRQAAFVIGIVISGTAVADTASDQLSRIEEETLILKAREKQLDVQAHILAKQNEIASKQQLNDHLTQNAVIGDPVIRAIEGLGKHFYATLQLSNGAVLDAQIGDVLPNGMRIASIKPGEVIAETGKRHRVRLSAASHAPAIFNPNIPAPGVGLPPGVPFAAPKGETK